MSKIDNNKRTIETIGNQKSMNKVATPMNQTKADVNQLSDGERIVVSQAEAEVSEAASFHHQKQFTVLGSNLAKGLKRNVMDVFCFLYFLKMRQSLETSQYFFEND